MTAGRTPEPGPRTWPLTWAFDFIPERDILRLGIAAQSCRCSWPAPDYQVAAGRGASGPTFAAEVAHEVARKIAHPVDAAGRCRSVQTDIRAVIECLLTASYSEHEIIDYLESAYGLTVQEAVAAVQDIAGGHAPIRRTRSEV